MFKVNGKPYFPATECAKVIGHKNPERAIREFCKGVTETVTPSAGGVQKKRFIPEGDLYRLIIRSKLPAAERFERWVLDEVLPSIRKHGAYVTEETLDKILQNNEYGAFLVRELQTERIKNAAMMEQIFEMEPKVEYCDNVLQSQNSVSVTLIAKDYGMSATTLNKILNLLKIQYKLRDTSG